MLIISGYKTSNTQFLLFYVFLLNHFSLKNFYKLSIKCNKQLYLTGCPFYAKCNKALGFCRCKSEYPIHLSAQSPCLNYKQLGKNCIHSSQCSQVSNAGCYDEDSDELNDIAILNKWFREKIVDINEDYEYRFENYGKCKCKIGYVLSGQSECKKMKLKNLACQNSRVCLYADKNAHCDSDTKICSCNFGYTYESDLDQCVKITKKQELDMKTFRGYKTNLTSGKLGTIETVLMIGFFIIFILFIIYLRRIVPSSLSIFESSSSYSRRVQELDETCFLEMDRITRVGGHDLHSDYETQVFRTYQKSNERKPI